MNRYGAQAMRHWKTYDPQKYAAIPDPETFFHQLGEQAEMQIQSLQTAIAGSDPPNETYLEKVGRLRMARLQAEEQILSELILIPSALPEDQEDWEDPDQENEYDPIQGIMDFRRQARQARQREREQDELEEMRRYQQELAQDQQNPQNRPSPSSPPPPAG